MISYIALILLLYKTYFDKIWVFCEFVFFSLLAFIYTLYFPVFTNEVHVSFYLLFYLPFVSISYRALWYHGYLTQIKEGIALAFLHIPVAYFWKIFLAAYFLGLL